MGPLTVPAVSKISSIHCAPSTSTCCSHKSRRFTTSRDSYLRRFVWCSSSAPHSVFKASITFLYESSIVGSYFSTKIPCTNWTVCGRTERQVGTGDHESWNESLSEEATSDAAKKTNLPGRTFPHLRSPRQPACIHAW